MLSISSQFDSGAIELVAIGSGEVGGTDANGGAEGNIDLRIRRDSHADFAQWFHFRLQGARGLPCTLRFLNAGMCAYPGGWEGYQVVASYDRRDWFRVPTDYADGVMTVRHTPEHDSVFYAYFEPYSWERHLAFIGRLALESRARVERLCASADGRDVDMVELSGVAPGARKVWVIARQHPGETMAEWFVEGMVERLLDRADPVAREILRRAMVRVVPNMNPDGSVRGNLRTSATGANLNREWMDPSAAMSPEVLAVRERLQAGGVDFFLDVHGDEVLPYVFIAGSEMLPGFTPAQAAAQAAFVADFKAASPDFQDKFGYAAGKYSADALKLASKWVGHTFGCLSLTLEMPFKDNANMPDARVGWSAARSKRLGAALLVPLLAHLRRRDGE